MSGKTTAALTLVEPGYYQDNIVLIHIDDRILTEKINRSPSLI
ncbi:hypothetical protein [Xenococcus sp. PCC 7305]|nr:hypothetical protein [Xenococcus sp. PCC 7305]